MRLIVAGSRGFENYALLSEELSRFKGYILEVVSGGARGADALGERWAREHQIPVKRFPADWNKFGKAAGYLRNKQMAEYADALVAFWDGKSRGTLSMIQLGNDRWRNRVKVVKY